MEAIKQRVNNPYLTRKRPYNIAHRGGAGLAPESTNKAFAHARTIPSIDALEIDVHWTADDIIIVTHDETMDRVSNISGNVRDLMWAEIRAADSGYHDPEFRGTGCCLITLDEFLTEYGHDYIINIDLKPDEPSLVPSFVEMLEKHGMMERVVVGSFHQTMVDRLRELAPNVATAASMSELINFYILHILRLTRLWKPHPQCVAFQMPVQGSVGIKIITPRFVANAHRHGIQVHAWTINDEQEMRDLLLMGVDGIITDYPDLMVT